MVKGQVISGEFGKILIRQKAGERIELGELLVGESSDSKILLQAVNLLYGSQISQQNLELISGINLEEGQDASFMEPELRNYNLAVLKNLITLNGDNASVCKKLPAFFSSVREIRKEDLSFLVKPKNPLFIGNLRSGSKMMDFPIYLDGADVFSHHVLVPATTGRGKSNMTSVILWDALSKDYCGILVLDPHDEYFGRNKLGLKDHPMKEKVVYYTPNEVPVGQRTLKINLSLVKPHHFSGVVDWSDAQLQALTQYFREFGNDWIEAIVLDKPLKADFFEGTLAVVKRRIMSLLDLEFNGSQLFSNGVFDLNAGETTITDICHELEEGKAVIIDTSDFSGSVEILIGSLIAHEILGNYRRFKMKGTLREKPVVSIVLEEAPRVLGKEALERGPNIFSTIAREGRKFKVGLFAITQLPSLIPREILANMNTKIILGIEMKPEREAIIQSAAQDLSEDDRNIASLDKGEAIISSNFAKFATPVKIPLFEDFAKLSKKEEVKRDFGGLIR
ncbi:MAG TPA: ATP-binding protein [Candidatus Nanoarchaeia archaeon]|nr:ATP-binding protein [Candidatus Nanoarchaeia archaeon]